MFILIDNYDSFTWNLWHFMSDLGAHVEVIRNDATTPDKVIATAPQGVVISPGPGTPDSAGISIPLIHAAKKVEFHFWACVWAIRRLEPPSVP